MTGPAALIPEPGVYAFLFTDLEGSTPQWEAHPVEMAAAVARHDQLVRAAVTAHDGQVFSTGGDGFAVVFPTPAGAVHTALGLQRALAAEAWRPEITIRARMAVHAGTAERRDANFFGTEVNRAARLAAAAHGGQLVVSQAAADLLGGSLEPGAELVDLGHYMLKGLTRPERIHQIVAPGLAGAERGLRATPADEGNLPAPVTSFVGRQDELAALVNQVHAQPVVSLVGPGGVGKTRLALEAAHRLAGAFPDGRWLCELAPVASPADVAWAVAGVLRARPAEGGSVVDAVVEHLFGRRALLMVDNCEHVLDAAAELVARVTAACPTVAVLATSREPLAVPAEQVWPVAGLDVAVDAARARTMTVADLAARLDDRFRLLRAPARGRAGRHQTLLAAVDWSYQLLDDRERALFDRLSGFPGSFDAPAATAVCGSPPVSADIVDELLHQLVDKSVVIADRSAPRTRFSLLETLRPIGAGRPGRCQLRRGPGMVPAGVAQRTRRRPRGARPARPGHLDRPARGHPLVCRSGRRGRSRRLGGGRRGTLRPPPRPPRPRRLLRPDAGRQRPSQGAGRNRDRCRRPRRPGHPALLALAFSPPLLRRQPARRDGRRSQGRCPHRPGRRQWLEEAARIAAPLHNPTLRMWLTFMCTGHAFAEGRDADAFDGFSQAALQAADCEATVWETRALILQASLGLGRPDVDALHHRVLTRFYAMRSWSDVLAACEWTLTTWAHQGRLRDAGTILGFLDANDIHHSLTAALRAAAAPIIRGDPDGERAVQHGATMSRDELVTYVIERLAATS